jgi:hypothetical protein
MIQEVRFREIKEEVDDALEEAFDTARKKEKENNDFLLFLSNAEFIDKYENITNFNPYVIDYRINKLRDQDRLKFLVEYLNEAYKFKEGKTIDSKKSLNLELMIYTHIWESKPFLRLLKKLSLLCGGEEYDWKVEIPDFSKHKFIRNIKTQFRSHKLKLAEVIERGYHSSLRNAFAHSEYIFDWNTPSFILSNYKGSDWEIQRLTFDEWTERFSYSFLLTLGFQNRFEGYKAAIKQGKPGHEVILKNKMNANKKGIIIYNSEGSGFSAKIIEG